MGDVTPPFLAWTATRESQNRRVIQFKWDLCRPFAISIAQSSNRGLVQQNHEHFQTWKFQSISGNLLLFYTTHMEKISFSYAIGITAGASAPCCAIYFWKESESIFYAFPLHNKVGSYFHSTAVTVLTEDQEHFHLQNLLRWSLKPLVAGLPQLG